MGLKWLESNNDWLIDCSNYSSLKLCEKTLWKVQQLIFARLHCAQAISGLNKDTPLRHLENYQTFVDVFELERMEIKAIKRQLVMCGLVERRTIDPPVFFRGRRSPLLRWSGSEGDHCSSLSAYESSWRCVQHRLLGIIVQGASGGGVVYLSHTQSPTCACIHNLDKDFSYKYSSFTGHPHYLLTPGTQIRGQSAAYNKPLEQKPRYRGQKTLSNMSAATVADGHSGIL